MNQYWYSNVDIHRKVITQELQYYLGPQATVRPYTFEVSGPSLERGDQRAVDLTACRAKTGFSSPLLGQLFQM